MRRPTGLTEHELLVWALSEKAAWDGQCLVWLGPLNGKATDRPRIKWGRKDVLVTRLILADQLGVSIDDLPADVHALHSCDRGECVTPEHIRPGSSGDNAADRESRGRSWQRKITHCPRGHALVEGNLVPGKLPKRSCLTCDRARGRNKTMTMDDALVAVLNDYPEMARAAQSKES